MDLAQVYIFALVGYIVYKCIDKKALMDKIKNLEE